MGFYKGVLSLIVILLFTAGCAAGNEESVENSGESAVSESVESRENKIASQVLQADDSALSAFEVSPADLPDVSLIEESDQIVQESNWLTLDDIPQYVYEVGQGQGLPVAIFLHGGPGVSYTDSADTMSDLADDVNLLFWDQIGAGRTFDQDPNVEPSMDNLTASLADLVDYAKRRYGVDQVAIIGHSWGSALGTHFVRDYPDDVNFYVGIGQVVTPAVDEQVAVRETIDLAEAEGRTDLIAELETIDPAYPTQDSFIEVAYDAAILRSSQTALGLGGQDFMQYMPLLLTGQTSDLSDSEAALLDRLLVNQRLYRQLLESDFYESGVSFDRPFYLISGENDIQVPASQAAILIEDIQAPEKNFYLVEDAGHTPMIDQPRAFNDILEKLFYENM